MKAFAPEIVEFSNPLQLAYYEDRLRQIIGEHVELHRTLDDTDRKYNIRFKEKVPLGVHERISLRSSCIGSPDDLSGEIMTWHLKEYGPKDSGCRRVFAVQNVDQKKSVVFLFGFGKYVGDEVPSQEAGGLAGRVRSSGRPNPRIILDSGVEVWGCECWWGPEERFAADYGKFTIVQASLEGFRAVSKGENN